MKIRKHIFQGPERVILSGLFLVLFLSSICAPYVFSYEKGEFSDSKSIFKKDNSYSNASYQFLCEENEQKESDELSEHKNRPGKYNDRLNVISNSLSILHTTLSDLNKNSNQIPRSCGNATGIPFYLAKRSLLI
jgi:hypothetical protein